MTDIIVTHHAAARYCERVNPTLAPIDAVDAIRQHSRAITIAAAFGCTSVKVGSGAHLILVGSVVVTVLERGQLPFQRLPWPGAQAR